MILINFAHPLTPAQLEHIAELAHRPIDRVIELPVQFSQDQPFMPQLEALLDLLPLSSTELQSESIVVNPPSLNFITALVLAALHGRMGYFPPIVRLRPTPDSLPPRYEVAELLNLQALRDGERKKRS